MKCSVCRTEIHPCSADALLTPRPYREYHEDFSAVLWWRMPIDEPPYVGAPDCSDAAREEGRMCGLEEAMAIAFASPGTLYVYEKIREHLGKVKEGKR